MTKKNEMVEHADGSRAWYRDGKLHREDGPAIEYADGDRLWYRDGYYMTFDEFLATAQPKHVPAILANEARRLAGVGS